ncbi:MULTISPECIES: PCRF domain-containing protein [unclassified Microcoleus]|uniref:PCRF domain-containing protein n=1 Tax=unclassified Microcoleus TaxID=2642155 RepID=UPI002FD7296A
MTAESQKLQQLTAQPASGNSTNTVEPILQELDALQFDRAKLNQCQTRFADINAAVELLEFQADGELEQELQTNLAQLNHSIEECEIEQLLSEPRDKNGAYLIINAAIHDLDAPDWVEMLLKMYIRWGHNRGYKVECVEESPASEVGINSVTLEIDGRYAYGYLKSETGMHRLQRTSPLNITRKWQTTKATVEVVPMYVELEIPQQDLEIILPSPYVISGKVPTWVRMVHRTGVLSISNCERSQLQNKEKALAVLKSKLFAIMQRQEVAEISDIQCDRLKTFLNQPIRKYQFASDSTNQDKVLDVRTGIEITAVAEVLDGQLDRFLKAAALLQN